MEALAESGFELPSESDMEYDLVAREENEERTALLHRAIRSLNKRQRYILKEIYVKRRTSAEIAADLGIDASAVRHSLQRILASLRKFFEEK